MQVLKSSFRRLCRVELPYRGRQKYMHSFDLAEAKMAEGFEDYLDPVVSLCRSAGATHGIAHMTVDEKIVQPGMSQRRPGPHVDGCFMPAASRWGHDDGPTWNHDCNKISGEVIGRMPVIVAASAVGCQVWCGEFHADPRCDGDLSHIADQLTD